MNKKKILLIDDERHLCDIMRDNLEFTGRYKVTTAYSGQEGLEKAKKINFDLVITDFKMPDMDGETVLNALKEMKPLLPVILFSIYHDDPSTITSSVKSKADGLIPKPFDKEELFGTIKDVLAKSRKK